MRWLAMRFFNVCTLNAVYGRFCGVEVPECDIGIVEGALAGAAGSLDLGPSRAGGGEVGAEDGEGDGQEARGWKAAHENKVAGLEEVLDGGEFFEGAQAVVEEEELGRRDGDGFGGKEVRVEEDGDGGADGGDGRVANVGDGVDVVGEGNVVAGKAHEVGEMWGVVEHELLEGGDDGAVGACQLEATRLACRGRRLEVCGVVHVVRV